MSTRDQNLTAALADVKAEIARTDNKIGLLLAFIGAVLAGVWTVATGIHPNTAAISTGAAGMAALAAAAGLLLRAVRPNLGGRVGFPLWATLTAHDIRAALEGDQRSQHIAALSRIAVAKFARLRRAVDLVCAGGLLLTAAALIVAGGAA
ncbi:integral membrane plasmid transfer protein [Mangrovactinospora gilvigrisea]|uniref:Integral membrane plasmid transfer protein n=1 Tax=Mangrovactinospora gilvigrisea TaxID=1428644 RepID=A0A1J7BGT4_9ACTN|nr:Pycsar system effector family protein [Mangrovactinospora gilvigrisea]OIV37862.1 integral membrane plasmid transfer protein [Mangrovactinospora gilvigrisea]